MDYKAPTTAITRRFAEFAVGLKYEDLSPAVVAAAKNGILDFMGVALIGARENATTILRDTTVGSEARGGSSIFGTRLATTAPRAALVNAYAAHVNDYDDVQPVVGGHISGALLGATLALAEAGKLSGKALIAAYVAGFEIYWRLGAFRRFGYHLRDHGVHPTGFLCHFAAAAGASNLLGLDVLKTRRSLGIAGGHATGLMRSFGTMCKGLNAGSAAHNAVVAAQLAQNGFTGPEDVFDGEASAFAVQGFEVDEEELFRDLGQVFYITQNTFKICACAGWRNPIIECIAKISKSNKLVASNVDSIEITICREVSKLPNYPMPESGLQAKFSAQYAAAVALVDHCGHVTQFSDQRVQDPALRELATKVTMNVDDSLELNQVRGRVRTNDGRDFTHFIAIPKGDPRNPLGWTELFEKFRANALPVIGRTRVKQLSEQIRSLDSLEDMGALARLCRPARTASAKRPVENVDAVSDAARAEAAA